MRDSVKLWLDLLRSGELLQGKGGLQQGYEYCCLGVACVAYERATGEKLKRVEADGNRLFGGHLGDHKKVTEWLGLSSRGGGFDGGSLIGMNDLDGKTFEETADFIETNPKGLFIGDSID